MREVGSLHELLAWVPRAPSALVILCVSNRSEVMQAGRVLSALAPAIRAGLWRVLCFNAVDLVKVGASLAHQGCADVLPYSLSRTGLVTKLHYNANLLTGGRPAEMAYLSPASAANFRETPEDYPTSVAAFTGFRLEVTLFPAAGALDAREMRAPGITAEIVERGTASLMLDLPDDGLIREGEELRAEIVFGRAEPRRANLHLHVTSLEACGDGRALVFAAVLSGDLRATESLFLELTDRQAQIENFLSETRGW